MVAVAAGHRGLLAARSVASAPEELNFIFHLILINLSSQMWLLVTVLDFPRAFKKNLFLFYFTNDSQSHSEDQCHYII